MIKDINHLKKELNIENLKLKNFVILKDEEVDLVRKFRNHPEVRRWMYSDHEINKSEHIEFISSLVKEEKKLYFLVLQDNLCLGVISLNRIDLKNRHAYLGIYANPEEKISNAGFFLGRALLKMSFEFIGLHSLKLEVIENNHRAINLYRKLGFKEEGRLREFVYKEGKWYDVIVMGMTEEEYFENEPKN